MRLLLLGNRVKLTAASLSKRAKSSLSSLTSSWALQDDDSWVKPTMSANKILHGNKRKDGTSILIMLLHPHKHPHSCTFSLLTELQSGIQSSAYFLFQLWIPNLYCLWCCWYTWQFSRHKHVRFCVPNWNRMKTMHKRKKRHCAIHPALAGVNQANKSQ